MVRSAWRAKRIVEELRSVGQVSRPSPPGLTVRRALRLDRHVGLGVQREPALPEVHELLRRDARPHQPATSVRPRTQKVVADLVGDDRQQVHPVGGRPSRKVGSGGTKWDEVGPCGTNRRGDPVNQGGFLTRER